MIDYNIISTGSKGNAVVINKTILIDCGVPFRALKDVYKDLQLALLTHRHVDHFNHATVKRLAQERPTLRFGVPKWLVDDVADYVNYKNIDVYNGETAQYYGSSFPVAIEMFTLKHNAPNCGWKLIFYGKESAVQSYTQILYATDTNSMDGIEAKNYDLYMLEANYSEAEITERIRRKQNSGEYCHEYDVLNNHLSKEKADDWLYQNMGPNSQYIYMHEHTEDK